MVELFPEISIMDENIDLNIEKLERISEQMQERKESLILKEKEKEIEVQKPAADPTLN